MFHFNAPNQSNSDDTTEDVIGPILRSAVEDFDDWVVDHDSYEMNETKERTLSRYAMEQLWIQHDKTKLLLLVKVDDDEEMFGGEDCCRRCDSEYRAHRDLREAIVARSCVVGYGSA